jgi:hypothetical protein
MASDIKYKVKTSFKEDRVSMECGYGWSSTFKEVVSEAVALAMGMGSALRFVFGEYRDDFSGKQTAIYCHKDKVPKLGTLVSNVQDYAGSIPGGRLLVHNQDSLCFADSFFRNAEASDEMLAGNGAVIILDDGRVVGHITVEVVK